MNPNDEQVTITRTEYDALVDSDRMLDALMAAGVDNWEGYSEACQQAEDADA